VAFSCTFLFSLANAISIRFKSHISGSNLTTVWPYTGTMFSNLMILELCAWIS
jgi:hypothetical protein